jgi:simple sugar transport system ATP-binding protein
MMVGRDVALIEVGGPRSDVRGPRSEGAVNAGAVPNFSTRGTAALAVKNLTVATAVRPRAVDGVSFEIAAGEIFGIAGVEGNGQTELVEAIAGLRPVVSGSIALAGRDITRAPVRERSDLGLSHIPEDRHQRGLILDYPIADNLILGQQHHFASRGMLDRSRVAANASHQIAAFDIRPPNASLAARALSGGNQQKVVVAREMGRNFVVLLASQPTRGVDVGAIEFIHGQLRAARAAGKGVLLVSAELSEVLVLSDRVAVMYGGQIVRVLPGAEATPDVVGPYMTGAAT